MIMPFIVTAAVIVLDQISKSIIAANMQIGESFNLIEYILNITYTTNPGASFGILKEHRWVFMLLSSVALVVMICAVIYLGQKKLKGDNLIIRIALAFMLGGGIGNMIDRIIHKEVVDFFEFAFVKFAIFNIADSFVCIGSVMFCICVFAGKYKLSAADKKNGGESAEEVENADNE